LHVSDILLRMKAQNTKTDIQHTHHKVDSNITTISKTKFVMANCSEMHPHTTTRWRQEMVTASTYVPLQTVTHEFANFVYSFEQRQKQSIQECVDNAS
jgi:hypothetical protein